MGFAKTTCIRLCGGAGNQLFQYAFGCAHSAVRDQVRFDTVNGFSRDLFGRAYALNEFSLNVRKAEPSDMPWGMNWHSPWHRFARMVWETCPSNYRQVYYEQLPFGYEAEAVSPSCITRYYWGYWQNVAYGEPISRTLREMIRLKNATSSFVKLQGEMHARKSLSVHVRTYRDLDRRGQVIESARQNHGACEPGYYERAIRYVPDHKHYHAYVFSDDPEWAKSNIRLPLPCTYVVDCGSFSAAEEIMLMAACQSHVISNSSFSWWGAWLGENPEKTVVAPKVWNSRLKCDQGGVCPADWIRI
jgi:hypothetical protein